MVAQDKLNQEVMAEIELKLRAAVELLFSDPVSSVTKLDLANIRYTVSANTYEPFEFPNKAMRDELRN